MKSEKIRVLYIDDRPKTVAPIIQILENDFEIKLECNAEEARMELLKKPYDVIILDFEMVKQDYADKILEKIRKENHHIKVILVTGKIRYVTELAKVVNWGISKCYFKTDVNLIQDLKKGILEVVDDRDSIIMGLESWINARTNRDKQILVINNKKYTARQILDEIKKNSEIGRHQIKALVLLLNDMMTKTQE